MNHKQRTKMLADYVLSQGHEKYNLIEQLESYIKRERRMIAQNHIWYHAMIALYGRAEARKELTELLKDIKGN